MQNSRWWNGILGAVSGLALVSGACQFWLNAGTSLPAQTGLLAMLLVCVTVHAWIPARWRCDLLPQSVRLFVVSAWQVALPYLFNGCWRLIGSLSPDLSSSVAGQCFCWTLLAMTTLAVPTFCALGLASSCRQTIFGSVLAMSFAVGGIGLGIVVGPDGCGLVSAIVGVIAFSTAIAHRIRHRAGTQTLDPSFPKEPAVKGETNRVLQFLSLIAVGTCWFIEQRAVRQLIPDSLALMSLECAILVGGIAIGRAVASENRQRNLLVCGISLSSWIWFSFLAFPLGVRLTLWENATVSQAWMLQSMRLLMMGLMIGPVGLSAGVLIGRRDAVAHSAAFLASPMATSWLLPKIGMNGLATIATGLLLIVAATSSFKARVQIRHESGQSLRQRALRVAVIATAVFALSAPVFVRYQPAVAAKLLFDTGVFVSSRANTPWEQLAALDEGRLTAIVEGDRGTLTAWKFAGSRLLVRENGIPKGTLATNASLAPRFVPDVLPIVLPLVAHERPQSVLLLGLRAAEPLIAATVFPLQQIVCVEADRGVISLGRSLLSQSETASAINDDRLAIRACDPALALRTMQERFDVIVASPDQPSLPQAANAFTVESFRAAAQRLTDEGIFAIRFQHIDLGPRSVRSLAKTMLEVFREVAAVEIAPGELLFLGTQSERGFAREGFIERWQRPHVRQLLASGGWDWSTPLKLSMQDHKAIERLASQPGAVVNVAARSTWAFRLPIEVMRWENKLQQVQEDLAKDGHFLMSWGGNEADNTDVAARLSEWELSRSIIRRHSDEFWAYRKQVKDHMTGSPRAMIQQVSHATTDSGLHPDDDRRLRYFRTIGELAKNPQLTESDLNRLRKFESPFDPLVAPFLHQEIVELTSRCSDRDAANELRHRLAAIYFSTPADRSIRNVTDALQFVNSTPDAIPKSVERFDHVNALLQMLLARWNARGEFRPTSSRVALNDIERSIAAAETSFATLDALAANGIVPIAEWNARKQFLERRLVRPLRTYRGQVVQHYLKNERTKDAVESLTPRDDIAETR